MLSYDPHSTIPAPPGQNASLSSEGGFTLIETLVAASTGIVVCLALFAVLVSSTRQETHLNDVAQATQLGRFAMDKIVTELHSACIAPGFTPIQEKSSENELRFINAYSEAAAISKEEVNEHRIVWNEKAETLTEYTYKATKEETWPKFKFSETPETNKPEKESPSVIIATHVTKMESGGSKIPIFQYYSYNLESSESATAGLSTLNTTPLTTSSLTAAEAATAASVLISFNTGSGASSTSVTNILGKGLAKDVTEGQQSQVTLSFSVPTSEAEKADTPCQ
jgi:type II secretory pathway pseudopilin PulG